ncbi:MAG: hypothetical protein LBF40_09305 [Deltaproteobacteria bacterium]|jgi:hypothetical protein|nr:hypothetical protein [Deltaproteobacteria bacterium]
MAKVGKYGQRVLKIVHLFFSSIWVGGAVSLWLMTLLLGPPKISWVLYGEATAIKFVDDFVIVPGAIGSLVSGILICCFTNWGFFKHPFVAVKLILTVICVLVGIFVLGPTVNGQPGLIAEFGLQALEEEAYMSNRNLCLLGGGFQLLAILFMLSISTLKPWSKKGSS